MSATDNLIERLKQSLDRARYRAGHGDSYAVEDTMALEDAIERLQGNDLIPPLADADGSWRP